MSREKAGRRENIYLPEMDLSARYDPSRNPVRGERESKNTERGLFSRWVAAQVVAFAAWSRLNAPRSSGQRIARRADRRRSR